MVVAATLNVAATDRFYLQDFTVAPGDTVTVEMMLENEMEYTSFQSDLYLPEGLEVLTETVELTGRKADHLVAGCLQPDGAVRIVSFSMATQAYSGHDGALVTFKVAASKTLQGPVAIEVRNTVFSDMHFVEIAFDDTTCTVNTRKPGDANGDGTVNITDATLIIACLISGVNPPNFNEVNADFNGDGTVNISDVTFLVNYILVN
jgi:hypothetical protein